LDHGQLADVLIGMADQTGVAQGVVLWCEQTRTPDRLTEREEASVCRRGVVTPRSCDRRHAISHLGCDLVAAARHLPG
jgi:hypothetical protein